MGSSRIRSLNLPHSGLCRQVNSKNSSPISSVTEATSSSSCRELANRFEPDLTAVAASGELSLVQELVRRGKDPDHPHPLSGLRPLHLAASRGHLDIVAFLIEEGGAAVDAPDKEGETALLKAAFAGQLEVVKYLVMKGNANPVHQDKEGYTALHNACARGYLDMAQFLVSQGVPVDARSRLGHTSLINAASKGDVPVVRFLLDHAHANPLLRNNFGETAYDAAAIIGAAYLCEILEAAERSWWTRIRRRRRDQGDPMEPYDSIAYHVTVPVIIHENQRAIPSLMMGLGRPSFSADALGKHDQCGPWSLHPSGQPTSKDRVELPSLTRSARWMWITDWTIDYSYPFTDPEGWQYSKSFSESDKKEWTAAIPTAGTGWVRRRRWIRIMRRRTDLEDLPRLTGNEDGILDLSDAEADGQVIEESAGQETEHRPDDRSQLDCNHDRSGTQETTTTDMNVIRSESVDYPRNEPEPRPSFTSRVSSSSRLSSEWIRRSRSSTASYSRPIYTWERNDQAPDCRHCGRWFNLLVRRHHCRRCGLVICDKCSLNRVMLPFSHIVQDPSVPLEQHYLISLRPQRVCDGCFEDLSRPRGSARPASFRMQRAPSTQSIMMECPVCGKDLNECGDVEEQEQHVQTCLNTRTPTTMTGIRYVVYKLASNSTLLGQECIICLEEFCEGDTMARLNCLCTYHRHCIQGWFAKGKECPIHSQ